MKKLSWMLESVSNYEKKKDSIFSRYIKKLTKLNLKIKREKDKNLFWSQLILNSSFIR